MRQCLSNVIFLAGLPRAQFNHWDLLVNSNGGRANWDWPRIRYVEATTEREIKQREEENLWKSM